MAGDPYQAALKAHAKHACRKGRLDSPDASATIDNPLCGDRITIDVNLTDGRIADFAQNVRGCLLCEASASMIASRAVGATAEQVTEARAAMEHMLRAPEQDDSDARPWNESADFAPVRAIKSRHECVLLPFEALVLALSEAEAGR
jgi:nitrogen fixation NifU-like protein